MPNTYYGYLKEFAQECPDKFMIGYDDVWMTNTQVLERVVCRAYAAAEDDQIFYILADAGTIRAAKKAGLSVIRYQAWQAAKAIDPAITAQEIQGMSMTQIRALLPFEKLEDPCH